MTPLWDRLASGKPVRVRLKLAMEVRPPKRAGGRPPIPRVAKFSHYDGWSGGGRPRCMARGCGKYLRRGQPFACSTACEIVVRGAVEVMAARVKGQDQP